MVYKTCSIKRVLAQIYRDYKPSNSGWIEDAVEWIGDAIDIMRCNQGYGEFKVNLTVADYHTKLPCEIKSVLGVAYNGARLKLDTGIGQERITANTELSCLPSSNQTYKLNANYIETPFESGCITLYYCGIEVDCDGYPYVIDDPFYREALCWYVLMKMMGRGFKHQVFSYQDAKFGWTDMYPKAQNRCKMPNIDRMSNWKKQWCGVIPHINREEEFFRAFGGGASTAHNVGDLLQTFQILGDREDD